MPRLLYLKWVLDGEDVDVALVEEVVEDVDGVSGGGALSLILSARLLIEVNIGYFGHRL